MEPILLQTPPASSDLFKPIVDRLTAPGTELALGIVIGLAILYRILAKREETSLKVADAIAQLAQEMAGTNKNLERIVSSQEKILEQMAESRFEDRSSSDRILSKLDNVDEQVAELRDDVKEFLLKK